MYEVFCGLCMAIADSVPGVSGGTVVYILGAYENFINALHSLFSKEKEKKNSIKYILKIGCGWIIGFLLSVIVLANTFETNIYTLSSLFLGLTIASIPFVILEERIDLKAKYSGIIFTIIGIIIVYLVTFTRSTSLMNSTINYSSLTPLQYVYLYICGFIAITAMVLPGISGSTLLLILGVYMPTIKAIQSFLHFDISVIPGGFIFALGILSGIIISVKFINSLFQKHKAQMIYFIIGLMIGSLYAIIKGPTTLTPSKAALDITTFSLPAFLLGCIILLGLESIKKIVQEKNSI